MPLIDINGSQPTIQHWPASLKIFGCNPYGESIFRVVRAESRYYLVGAYHVDYDGAPSSDRVVKAKGKDPNARQRVREYRWTPLYPGIHGWILEKWCSPQGFTGCDLETYNDRYKDPESGLLTLGPYPERGEFAQCHTFPGEPTWSQIENTIYLIKAGWSYSYNDKRIANRDALEKKQKDTGEKRLDIMRDAQQAFRNKPTNIRPGKRTKDRIKLTHDAPMKKKGFYTYAGNN